MRDLSLKAKVFVALVVGSGAALLVNAFWHWKSPSWDEFTALLLVALVAARLHVKLPGVSGTLSVNLPFILVAVAEMGAAEALLVGCLSTLVQCLPRAGKKFSWTRSLFSIATIGLAVTVARLLYNSGALQSAIPSHALLLAMATAGYFAANSIPVAIIIALTEGRSWWRAWGAMLQLSYPYYLASAGVGAVVLTACTHIGWQVPLVVLPLMAGMYLSYRRYFSVVASAKEQEKKAPQAVAVAHAAS